MPELKRFDPSTFPWIATRRCPNCGLRGWFLSYIEPTENDGYENRTYECSMCTYEETVRTKFR
jgi:hypothetical protein